MVVISRMKRGSGDRVYVVQEMKNIFGATDDIDQATRFERSDAQKMIDRGSWHDLSPKLITVPYEAR